MYKLWVEKFVQEVVDEDEAAVRKDIIPEPRQDGVVGPADFGNDDLGVAEESKLSPEQLRADFGLSGHQWFGFNQYQHPLGTVNAWEQPKKYQELVDEAERTGSTDVMQPVEMKWHQMVAIRAMARLSASTPATSIPREEQGAILLADGVGTGKTCTVIGFITLLKHLRVVTTNGTARPSVFRR
jgi:hypothetical protein